MNYIILDLEWNQALSYSRIVKWPVFLTGEIVQIGAVKLNENFKEIDSFSCRIAPRYYKVIHPEVAKITHLSTFDLKEGVTFSEAISSFCDWCGKVCIFLVWGTEDQRILRKNMELYGINTEQLPKCFNLQNVFASQITHNTRQYGLTAALDILKESAFAAHDALNDAKSTLLVCNHLDLNRGLTEYKAIVENKDGIVESYEFEESFAGIEDALDDDYVVSFECPMCGEIVWGDNWVRKTRTEYLSICRCSDGQAFFIKLKFRWLANRTVLVKRLVFELNDRLQADYDKCVAYAAVWAKYVVASTC